MIAGIPKTNRLCSVLWRNACIPMSTPTLPPMAATANRSSSGMRHSPRRARALSARIMTNPARLTATRQKTANKANPGIAGFLKGRISTRRHGVGNVAHDRRAEQHGTPHMVVRPDSARRNRARCTGTPGLSEDVRLAPVERPAFRAYGNPCIQKPPAPETFPERAARAFRPRCRTVKYRIAAKRHRGITSSRRPDRRPRA